MKFLTILQKYLKGIRLSILLLALMMTWTIFIGITAYGRVEYILNDVKVLKSGNVDNAYMLMYLPTPEDLMTGADMDKAAQTEVLLEQEAIVEHVFSIRTVTPVIYEKENITIILYEPEMLAYFPGIKKLGIDFTDCPDGCILGSSLFNQLDAGDTITLNFSKNATAPKKCTFPVAGHMTPPYRQMSFSQTSGAPVASNLFEESQTVLMQATDTVMAQLEPLARCIDHNTNLMIVFKEGTSAQEQEQLLSKLARDYSRTPLAEMIQNSEKNASAMLKEELPQPLFMTCASLLAFLSVTILIFKKKERDIAVLYLCGCSRRQYALLTFTVFHLFALLPVILNIVIVQLWPHLTWNINGLFHIRIMSFLQEQGRVGLTVSNIFSEFYLALSKSRLNATSLLIIGAYYLSTVAISLAVTVGTMKKHTPITYLKGASQ